VALERIRETFNDGVLQYGKFKTQRSDNRKNLGRSFVPSGTLFYRKLSVRESDYLEFGSMGSTLDLKVKTPVPPGLTKLNKDTFVIRIDDEDYEIIATDRDSFYLYFYLHKVGEGNE
jgi:SPP1 family predicted phage head-tail adaptor